MINLRRRVMGRLGKEYPFVDLRLPSGLLWATYNIGASTPEEAGLYFSWGNVEGHAAGSGYNFGYNNNGSYASTPGKNVSANIASNDATHDAALACFGSPWHLPTKENFQEIYNNTDREWTSINGSNGWKFMKKTDHSVFVFFPAAGRIVGTSLHDIGMNGYYWSSSFRSADRAYYMFLNSSTIGSQWDDYRYYGMTIRPVYDPSL